MRCSSHIDVLHDLHKSNYAIKGAFMHIIMHDNIEKQEIRNDKLMLINVNKYFNNL